MSAVVELDHVSFQYPGATGWALRDVSLRIGRGEVVGVVGQNGSGKTTLTKLVNALLPATDGVVTVDGVPNAGRRVQELAATVGYVFQNPNHQLFAQTVQAELEFGPRNIAMPPEEIGRRVAQVVEFFGIGALLDEHPYRCSFPQRKLVAIASVVAMDPAVIILDEPTTGQDHATTGIINSLVRRLAAQGTTVLCVSHDMPLLADVAERVVVMRDSELVADATPAQVFADHDLMASTNLDCPQVTDLGLRTVVPRGGPVPMRVPELVETVVALAGRSRPTTVLPTSGVTR